MTPLLYVPAVVVTHLCWICDLDVGGLDQW